MPTPSDLFRVECLGDLPAELIPEVRHLLELLGKGRMSATDFEEEYREVTGRPAPAAGEPAPLGPWPDGLDPATMPTYLAHPWASLIGERHPRVRLHWLVDTAELTVRWLVAVLLAEVVGAHRGLPEDLRRRMRPRIERPTLGMWLDMLEDLSAARPAPPLLVGPAFDLFDCVVKPLFRPEAGRAEEGDVESRSLEALRNKLAHGGGLSIEGARTLLDRHLPGLECLLRAAIEATEGCEVVAVLDGHPRRLVGQTPTSCILPASISARNGTWLVGAAGALPLLPLAAFDIVCHENAHGVMTPCSGVPAAQIFARSDRHRLRYNPLGRDEVYAEVTDAAAFRDLFGLDDAWSGGRESTQDRGFRWDDFLQAARLDAEELVGRQVELKTAKAWLKSREPRTAGIARIGWIAGGPGLGKSMLMAKLARDASNANTAEHGVFYHGFRAGDARNSRNAFLRLLQGALWAWPPLTAVSAAPTAETADGVALRDDVKARLGAIASLAPAQPGGLTFRVFVDGLDEVVGSDPGLLSLLREFAQPGTVWLLAGRPERGLDAALSGEGCEALFPDGLPPMCDLDVRDMLIAGLGLARYPLLKRDVDQADGGVGNAFVERVVERAAGLPLYVHLVLEDLCAGTFTVRDEHWLPASLTAYYDGLLQRSGISDASKDLTDIVCLLAQAEEPLDAPGLAALLGDRESVADYLPRVEAALRVGQALLRRAPSPDADDAWSLYHESFREHVAGRPANGLRPAVAPALGLAGSIRDAQKRLVGAASEWRALDAPTLRPLRNHLFRWGTRYAIAWGGDGGADAALKRLTDFGYLQARTAALPASESSRLVDDYTALLRWVPSGDNRDAVRVWEAFFRERLHLLRRGNTEWPANRVLLQLAAEHADDSPVTRAAEEWLGTGACDWLWLRRAGRHARVQRTNCLAVLEGHSGPVTGARVLMDGRILSWSANGALRLWDPETVQAPMAFLAHTAAVSGATELLDGRLLSWGGDHTLRLWDPPALEPVATLLGHRAAVAGAHITDGGQLLTWEAARAGRYAWTKGSTLTWDLPPPASPDRRVGAPAASAAPVPLASERDVVLPDGRVLGWTSEYARVWQEGAEAGTAGPDDCWRQEGECLGSIFGQRCSISGAWVLSGGQLLVQLPQDDLRDLHIWDGKSGISVELDEVSCGRSEPQRLPDGRLIVNSGHIIDGGFCIGIPLVASDAAELTDVLPLRDGKVATWASDCVLRVWSTSDGTLLATLRGHPRPVQGAIELADDELLSWSVDGTLRVWDARLGRCRWSFVGHKGPVVGALPLRDGRLLSWSTDGSLRVWERRESEPIVLRGHASGVTGAVQLQDERILSWSRDGTLRIWGRSGVADATLIGHCLPIRGVRAIGGARVLSWSKESILLWDLSRAQAPAKLRFQGIDEVVGLQILENKGVVVWNGSFVRWVHPNDWAAIERAEFPQNGCTLLRTTGCGSEEASVVRAPSFGGHFLIGRWGPARSSQWQWRAKQRSEHDTYELYDIRDRRRVAGWVEPDRTYAIAGGIPAGALLLDDERVLSWYEDSDDLCLWDGRTGDGIAVLNAHRGRVLGAQILPDGGVLCRYGDGAPMIWRVGPTPRRVVAVAPEDAMLGCISLSDNRLLTWHRSHALMVWHLASGTRLLTLRGHTATVHGACQLPSGELLSWSDDGSLRRWDEVTGVELKTLRGHAGAVTGAVSLSEGVAASWSVDSTLRLWRVGGMDRVSQLGAVSGVLLLPGSRVLVWSDDHGLRVWDATTGGVAMEVGYLAQEVKNAFGQSAKSDPSAAVLGAALLTEGRLATWSSDQILRIWDAATLEPRGAFFWDANNGVVLSDGRLLAWDYGMSIEDTRTGAVVVRSQRREGDRQNPGGEDVLGSTLLPDGRVLFWDHQAPSVWDVENRVCTKLCPSAGFPGDCAGVPQGDGRMFLKCADSGQSWNIGAPLAILDGNGCAAVGVLSIPGQQVLVSWAGNGSMFVWDLVSRRVIATLVGHQGSVMGALLSSFGDLLTWSNDGTVRAWDVAMGACVGVLEGFVGPVRGVQLLSDGRALCWSDRDLRVWDARDCSTLKLISGAATALSGAVALEGGRAVSWSPRGEMLLWDTVSGLEICALEGHTGEVTGALALPGGRIMTWCGQVWDRDGSIVVWDAGSGKALITFRGHEDAVLGAVLLSNGDICSWAKDGGAVTALVWASGSGEVRNEVGHAEELAGAQVLVDLRDRVFGWDGPDRFSIDILTPRAPRKHGVYAAYVSPVPVGRPALFPDGRLLCWAEDELCVWDADAEQFIARLEVDDARVYDATPLWDGRVAYCCSDGCIRIWEVPEQMTDSGPTMPGPSPSSEPAPETLGPFSIHASRSSLGLRAGDVKVAVCHGDGWDWHDVLADGTIIATAVGEVAILHLYHGGRRSALRSRHEITFDIWVRGASV